MTDKTTVADLFGESTANRIQRAKNQHWKITTALTTEFTSKEKNPPDGVSERERARIRLGDSSRFVIRKAKSEYGLSDETETVKKLLRTGLPEIYLEWKDEIKRLAEIDDAITHSSGYIEADITLPVSDEQWDLKIESHSESERYYIFWYQDFYADKLSKELSIPKTQVLQMGIIMAGRELKRADEVPAEKGERIRTIVEKVDGKLQRRISNLEQLAFGTMVTAWDSKDSEKLHSKLQSECPKVLEGFSNRIGQLSEELDE